MREYAVFRKEKRIICITTISMAGDVLMPLLVILRKTIDNTVWEDGRRDGHDFMIRSNDTASVTSSVFTEYLTGVTFHPVLRHELGDNETPKFPWCSTQRQL
jgi:hypothetical protein